MKDWVHFVTLLMTVTVVLIMISTLYGCSTFDIAKETAKIVDMVWPKEEAVEDKNVPNTIIVTDLESNVELDETANTIACIKLQPECRPNE